jgi:hypothetical protein
MLFCFNTLLLLLLLSERGAIALGFSHKTATLPQITSRPEQRVQELRKRQSLITTFSTCGFKDGDVNQPRTANSGFNCHVNLDYGLWAFCTTTVRVASQCRMIGQCFDNFSCLKGCGSAGTPGVETTTWYEASFA